MSVVSCAVKVRIKTGIKKSARIGCLLIAVHVLAGCWFVESNLCNDSQASVQGVTTADWMSQVYANQDISLQNMIIPGTHDSGTHGITHASAISPDADPLYHLPNPIIPIFAAGWSKTQACTIAQQLEGGIRYLDLRLEWHQGEVWIVHAMFSDTLDNVLQDIQAFAADHPREIVILDFQQLTAAAYYDETHAQVQAALGDYLLGSEWEASSSLHAIWQANEGSLIAVMSRQDMVDLSDDYWYRNTVLESDWANSPDAEQVLSHITTAIEQRANGKFSVAQAVVTPGVSSVIDGIAGSGPGSLFDLNQPVVRDIDDWLEGWLSSGLPVNIVMTDFYDRSGIVQVIIEKNLQAL